MNENEKCKNINSVETFRGDFNPKSPTNYAHGAGDCLPPGKQLTCLLPYILTRKKT